MIERFGVLGSQALILGALWLCGLLYRQFLKRVTGNPRSEDDAVAWAKANLRKRVLLAAPLAIVFAPATEELLWRAPLIAAFGAMEEPGAWSFAFASSIVFGLTHFDRLIPVEIKINNATVSEGTMLLARIGRAICAAMFGLALTYYGITRQSLFLAFGLHVAWNAALWIGLPQIIVVLACIAGLFLRNLVFDLWERLAWWTARYESRHYRWRLAKRLAIRRDVEDERAP